jgi:DNA-binding response OmpR family regulator
MTKKRLLIIEDDVDVAEMLVIYFTSQGYEVLNTITGHDGIATARAKFPNLILLDVMLPDMDGFEVAKTLRTTPLTKYIPITFLTQRDARADKVAGLELGADDYVTKPFDIEELRLRIQGSFRRSAREQLQDPRTGLPTNALIEVAKQTFSKRKGIAQLDVQLVGFQSFRDKYGFVAGDEALDYTGQVFSKALAESGTPDDFAGQSSEEHYVIFTDTTNVPAVTKNLITSFSSGVKKFYNFTDSEQGYIIINEAQDEERFISLMHIVVSPVFQ